MTRSRTLPRSLAALGLVAVAGLTSIEAQSPQPYQPKEYQPGKDVVWVPTAQALVEAMLDMAKVTPSRYVIDLGSGDGRRRHSPRPGAAPRRWASSTTPKWSSWRAGTPRRRRRRQGDVRQADLYKTDLSKAPSSPCSCCRRSTSACAQILAMNPGTRVVSNSFDMGDWRADQVIASSATAAPSAAPSSGWCPPEVEGAWRLGEGRLVLEQKYQMLKGSPDLGRCRCAGQGPARPSVAPDAPSPPAAPSTRPGAWRRHGRHQRDGKAAPWRATR